MLGGLFLCFEGVEKLVHAWGPKDQARVEHAELARAVADESVDLVAREKEKIKGAVRTDFILSAEIIVITLGTVATAGMGTRVTVLVGISLLMTVGVYGLVAGIVKLDDLGLHLARQAQAWKASLGRGILGLAPWLMKSLSVVGTAAMFLVGGGILLHGLPALAHAVEALSAPLGGWSAVLNALAGAALGMVAGAVVVALLAGVRRWRGA
jgi:predicted DNA repair protein MutK